MAFTAAAKAEIVKTYGKSANDTGSTEVQIALLTTRINYLTEHLKTNNHDFHTRFGLTNMVSQRRRLLAYLKRKDIKKYRELLQKLEVRG